MRELEDIGLYEEVNGENIDINEMPRHYPHARLPHSSADSAPFRRWHIAMTTMVAAMRLFHLPHYDTLALFSRYFAAIKCRLSRKIRLTPPKTSHFSHFSRLRLL